MDRSFGIRRPMMDRTALSSVRPGNRRVGYTRSARVLSPFSMFTRTVNPMSDDFLLVLGNHPNEKSVRVESLSK